MLACMEGSNPRQIKASHFLGGLPPLPRPEEFPVLLGAFFKNGFIFALL